MTDMNKQVLVSPSIIASDLSVMGGLVTGFDSSIVDLLHMDVMDGRFVPNITFGPAYIADLMKKTSIPFDVHLMIEQPEGSLDAYLALKPWVITIQYESTRFPARLMTAIRDAGIRSGIAVNPATPVEALFDILSYADMVLIMSVDPGFYGQSFMEPALDRIRRLRERIGQRASGVPLIQVDGGINSGNIGAVCSAGADIVVAGNAAFTGGTVNENVRRLKARALEILS
jgi:ribulose-phosphate 3-epimerase